MPYIQKIWGARYDILTYLLAIERLREEGNSLITFFSAHISIGERFFRHGGTMNNKSDIYHVLLRAKT